MVSFLPFLLLLLLLPGLLAVKVKVRITQGVTIITTDNEMISERRSGHVSCVDRWAGFPCVFQCTFLSKWIVNESFVSLDAEVTSGENGKVYNMAHNIKCTLHPCKEDIILPLLSSLSLSKPADLMELFYIRNSCPRLFSTNHKVMKLFIVLEKQIIHSIMRLSKVQSGSSVNYRLGDISLTVLNQSAAHMTSPLQIEAPALLPQNSSSLPDIILPVNVLHDNTTTKIIGLVSYMFHRQFQFEQEDISSMVLRIELLHDPLHDLSPPIEIIFRKTSPKSVHNDSRYECHYFDDQQDFRWRTHGSQTIQGMYHNESDVICHYNHTTPFAVLLIRESISEVHWKILSYISYIGCGLSAFFTALSLVIFVFNRNKKKDHSISIHVSLSGALFVLNSTFLLTEWGATVKPDWVCVLVAALMHYSLLCCFTWMAIEALHLYLLLIRVFNTFYKHYLIKLSLVGWGIPAVIVGISLALKDFKQFYGLTEMTMADTNQTNAICWIIDDSFFYAVNLVYFTLIFIFNSGILVAVASSICKMKQTFRGNSVTKGKTWRDPQRFSDSCRGGLTVLGLTCLMGTTWGLAFLGSGHVNYPILYLFCILNSTQGFFIFLWICLSARRQRRNDLEEKITHTTPARSLGTKSD